VSELTLQALRDLVANDSFATGFQSLAQYRGALLRQFDILIESPAAPSNSHSEEGEKGCAAC